MTLIQAIVSVSCAQERVQISVNYDAGILKVPDELKGLSYSVYKNSEKPKLDEIDILLKMKIPGVKIVVEGASPPPPPKPERPSNISWGNCPPFLKV